jgi:hypothetical protein
MDAALRPRLGERTRNSDGQPGVILFGPFEGLGIYFGPVLQRGSAEDRLAQMYRARHV